MVLSRVWRPFLVAVVHAGNARRMLGAGRGSQKRFILISVGNGVSACLCACMFTPPLHLLLFLKKPPPSSFLWLPRVVLCFLVPLMWCQITPPRQDGSLLLWSPPSLATPTTLGLLCTCLFPPPCLFPVQFGLLLHLPHRVCVCVCVCVCVFVLFCF